MPFFRPLASLAVTVALMSALAALTLSAALHQGRLHDDELAALESELVAQRVEIDDMQARLKALEAKGARPQPKPDPEVMYAVPVGDAHASGPRDAPVTIVEYVDLQCPFCARVQPTLDEVRRIYGHKVRLVFKHNPLAFHPRAHAAAVAAECTAEHGGFWRMQGILWDNTRALDDADLARYAAHADVPLTAWRRCVDEQEPRERIARDQAEAARFGARGTPTFFVNGRPLVGAQPLAAFQARIDEELARVARSGVTPGRYYDDVVLREGVARAE